MARLRRGLGGYKRASNVALDLLQRHIDELGTQVKSGGTLTKQDQYLHAKLIDIKAELQRELNETWESDAEPGAGGESASR